MIKATVLTKRDCKEELHFEDIEKYKRWHTHWTHNKTSKRLIHGWFRSIMYKDITRVISVEEEN